MASATAHAVTLADPAHFAFGSTYTPSVPTPYGALRFSADGTTLYAVGGADSSGSALYAMSVSRNAGGRVTSLGSPVKVFGGAPSYADPAGLDAGLEFGPSGTLFYTYYPSPNLAQRPGGIAGVEQEFALPGITSVAGLTFSPHRTDAGTGFGTLQVTTGITQNVYEVPLVASGTPGYYVLPGGGALSLFAKLYRLGPPRVGGQGVTGLQYVPGGTYGGDLLYSSYVDRELWRVAIDPATGLPVGGTQTPTEELFASAFSTPPFGLVFDPAHPDSLFVSTWDDTVASGNVIMEITGFAASFGTTTTSTSTPTTTSTSSSSSTSSSTAAPVTTLPSTTSTSTSTSAPDSSSTTTEAPSTSSTSDTTPSTTSSTSTLDVTSTTSSTTSSTDTPTTSSSTSSEPSSTSTSTTSSSTTPTTTSTSTSTSAPPTTSSTVTTTSNSSTSSAPSSTSVSSTSTSSSTSAPTTTLPLVCDPSDPASCDDGDACTADTCEGGTRCRWDALTGIAGVTCACEQLVPAECRGADLPHRVGALSARACALFAGAADAGPVPRRHRLTRGAKLLRRTGTLVERAQAHGTLSSGCADALVGRLADAQARARALAETR